LPLNNPLVALGGPLAPFLFALWILIAQRVNNERVESLVQRINDGEGVAAYDYQWDWNDPNWWSIEEGTPPGTWLGRALLGNNYAAAISILRIDPTTPMRLGELALCPRLEALSFYGREVPADEWACLSNLRSVKFLMLAHTNLSDGDLSTVGNLRTIIILSLADTDITDEGIHHIVDLPSLQQLYLDHTTITDEGVKLLAAKCPKLWYLSLRDTLITGESLKALRNMQSIEIIDIVGTSVPEDAILELQRARPDIEVVY